MVVSRQRVNCGMVCLPVTLPLVVLFVVDVDEEVGHVSVDRKTTQRCVNITGL